MRNRALAHAVEEFAFADHKIALVSGPRQCGKTTLAKMLLGRRKVGLYRNWDELEFRRSWAQQPTWKAHAFGAAQVLVAGAAEALGYFA